MKEQTWVTSRDLLREAGVSRRTLANWQARGILPAPRKGRIAGSAGIRGYWRPNVVAHLRKVRRLLDEGYTLDAIAHLSAEQREALRPLNLAWDSAPDVVCETPTTEDDITARLRAIQVQLDAWDHGGWRALSLDDSRFLLHLALVHVASLK